MNKNAQLKNQIYGFIAGTLLSLVSISLFEKITSTENSQKQNVESFSDNNILVLDDFEEKEIYVNDDDTCDITHGELISKIIESELPNYNVEKKEAHICRFSSPLYKQSLLNDVTDKNYRAVNVSIGAHISYDELSQRTGIDVTRENLAANAKKIKAYFKQHPNECLMETTFLPAKMGGVSDFIDALDSLSAKGTKIYVSTCNEGPHYLNLISLVDGAVVVGASDSTGTKYYSSENSLVKRHYDDKIKITKTKDGYSIDNGKTTAFKNIEVSKGSNKPYLKTYEGASFATPRVLVADLSIHK